MENFDLRATAVKKTVELNKGVAPGKKDVAVEGEKLSRPAVRQSLLVDMKEAVRQLEALRAGSPTDNLLPVDLTFGEFVKEKWGFSHNDQGCANSSFFDALGIDPSRHSVESLFTMPEFNEGYRWLVPEVIREAIRTGLRRNPIYPNLIAAEENITQLQVTMPTINMSDAMPKKIGEAESIPMGNVSFGQKQVNISKVAIGMTMTDEVMKFASLNVMSIFLQDMGVKLNQALDTEAIDTLINGDQAGGGDAVAVVGVTAAGTLTYRDILRVWIRMSRLGRLPAGFLANENAAMDYLELAEFKALAGIATLQKLEISTALPTSQKIWVHGAMVSDNQALFIDKSAALIKLNAAPLTLETERIANRQISGTYASLMTGFATMFRDARVVLDKSLPYAANQFPAYMNPSAFETVRFK